MPRARQSSSGLRLSPSQAQQILQEMISDGRISTADVNRYVEIQQLEERLQSLRSGRGAVGRRGGWRSAARPAAQRGRRRRRRAITPDQLASRQLQGRYLALVRQIPANRRAHYAKIAKDRGREAAIREMQGAVGGRAAAGRGGAQRAGRRRRRRSKVTGEQLASRQLQGRYLGLVRQISASQRSRYAKIAKDRGREAAIKEMQSALSK